MHHQYTPCAACANASACELVGVIDLHGWSGIEWRLERIEEVMSGMSRRSRLLRLNARIHADLDAARAAKQGRRT